MPYRDAEKRRAAWRESKRRRRAAAKAARDADAPDPPPLVLQTDDPIGRLAAWSQNVLRVPDGHPNAGQPMTLPPWAQAFLRDAHTHRESLLCVARKNAKSAIVAIYVLGHLVGPLATRGWRCGVASVDRLKAAELKLQLQAIAEASLLAGLEFWKSPAPGWVQGPSGRVDILSADKSSGHASGFDVSIVDELGLLAERDRPLVNGMRSATSARDGRFIALSIQGDAPFTAEMIERAGARSTAVHLYQSDPEADPFDPETWKASNPGLGDVKSMQYMVDRAEQAKFSPLDLADFAAFDLNAPQSPAREMIVAPDEWAAISTMDPPPRAGPCVVGLDAGGSTSMTAAAVVWPETGRMEVRGAFPVTAGYDLAARGRSDGVGSRYVQLHEAGELAVYEGRTTPVVAFLRDLADDLADEDVVAMGFDRHRREEVLSFLEDALIRWPPAPRGQGKSATADGSADVRYFQRAVLDGWLRPGPGRLMVHAIAESALIRDSLGNPAIERARARGRIDPLSAAVIAVGLAARMRAVPEREYASIRL